MLLTGPAHIDTVIKWPGLHLVCHDGDVVMNKKCYDADMAVKTGKIWLFEKVDVQNG
jgi:hypothetical protein